MVDPSLARVAGRSTVCDLRRLAPSAVSSTVDLTRRPNLEALRVLWAVSSPKRSVVVRSAIGSGEESLGFVVIDHGHDRSVLVLNAESVGPALVPEVFPGLQVWTDHVADTRPRDEPSKPEIVDAGWVSLAAAADQAHRLPRGDTAETQRRNLLRLWAATTRLDDGLVEAYAAIGLPFDMRYSTSPFLLAFDGISAGHHTLGIEPWADLPLPLAETVGARSAGHDATVVKTLCVNTGLTAGTRFTAPPDEVADLTTAVVELLARARPDRAALVASAGVSAQDPLALGATEQALHVIAALR